MDTPLVGTDNQPNQAMSVLSALLMTLSVNAAHERDELVVWLIALLSETRESDLSTLDNLANGW